LNNRIVDNSSPYGAGVACDSNSSPLIAGNLIEENAATWFGGGVYCFDNSSPVMLQNVIRENSAGQQGGGVYCQSTCSPVITENGISGNTAYMSGGGMYFHGTCSPTITGNLISNNTAQTNFGGGIAVAIMSMADIFDNTLDGNSAVSGGGIYLDLTSSATIVNTIVTNTPAGKGIRNAGDYPTIIFCDVWNNLDENYYGCIPGEGCISENPLFCDPGNHDYSLWFTSPCLGTGQDGSDIGAFGQGCSVAGDANADGEINIGDIVYLVNYLYKGGPAPTPVPAGDANGDGVVDVGDIVYLVNYLYRCGAAYDKAKIR
jgi:parallel beta-helix repeat protein/predicted outer membrane repeat protein